MDIIDERGCKGMSLCNKHYFKHVNTSPQRRIDTSTKSLVIKEASLCIFQKASLSVEAAVVIPLVCAFYVTILFLFHVLSIQVRVEEALYYAGRKVAVESTVVTDEVLQFASAQAILAWELGEDKRIERYVEGGALGVTLLGSKFQEDRVELVATYRVKFPLSFMGIEDIGLWNRGSFQKWVGDLPKEEAGEVVVYITPNGSVYHRLESCRALTIRVKQAFFWTMESIRGENGQKYYACSRCVEKISKEDLVYYTDYGERYHQRINCSYIKRTYEKKKLSEVTDKRPCSLCCGGNESD